jgi:hypothetical protein
MNLAQKWITIGSACVLVLVLIFPPWHQTHRGEPLIYKEDLGHHLLWSAPLATGEEKVPASECKVAIDRDVLLGQCGIVIAMGAILCFAFRGRPSATVTIRSLVITSLFLALCLPLLSWSEGVPLIIWVLMAVIGLFIGTGHINSWDMLFLVGRSLTLYFSAIFVLLSGALWIARRRRPPTPGNVNGPTNL